MALKAAPGLQDWEIAVVRKVVAELRRHWPVLARDEADDLMQECLLHWLAVRARATPGPDGPPVAYLARVARNRLIDLARERDADKRRGDVTALSLDAPLGEAEDAPTLADLMADHRDADLGGGAHDAGEDVRLDLVAVMRQLSARQRRLCELIGSEGLSIKAAAEQLAMPRGTLYEEIKRIRAVFAAHGLDGYLRR